MVWNSIRACQYTQSWLSNEQQAITFTNSLRRKTMLTPLNYKMKMIIQIKYMPIIRKLGSRFPRIPHHRFPA